MSGGGVGSGPRPRGGPSVIPGRTGAAWNRCRREVIRRAGNVCAICLGYVDPKAPNHSDGQGNVDHYPTPLHKLKDIYGEGTPEYIRAANDPNGARLTHRKCHRDRDVIPSAADAVRRTRSAEWDDLAPDLTGVDTGPANAYDLAEVVADLERRQRTTSHGTPHRIGIA